MSILGGKKYEDFRKKRLQLMARCGIIAGVPQERERKRAYLPVAQLDRATDSDSVGRRFESCRVGQKVPLQGSPWRGTFSFARLVSQDAMRFFRRKNARRTCAPSQSSESCRVGHKRAIKKISPQKTLIFQIFFAF